MHRYAFTVYESKKNCKLFSIKYNNRVITTFFKWRARSTASTKNVQKKKRIDNKKYILFNVALTLNWRDENSVVCFESGRAAHNSVSVRAEQLTQSHRYKMVRKKITLTHTHTITAFECISILAWMHHGRVKCFLSLYENNKFVIRNECIARFRIAFECNAAHRYIQRLDVFVAAAVIEMICDFSFSYAFASAIDTDRTETIT